MRPVASCSKSYFLCGYRVKRFVAMKVVKSAEHYTETAVDEIKLLKSVSSLVLLQATIIYSISQTK